jgi:hypothetical protein
MAIQYTSGTNKINVATTISTKADICAMIDTNITTGAGWTVTNTASSTDHTYQSAATPQGNQIQVRVWDGGGNCVRIRLMNNAQTIVQSDSCYLFPATSTTYQMIGNQYQMCIFVPGSVSTRNFVIFSALYIPPFLVSLGLTTSAIIMGDGGSDTDSSNSRGSWRTSMTSRGFVGAAPSQGFTIVNGTSVEYNGLTADSSPHPGLPSFQLSQSASLDSISGVRWHDGSYFIEEPLVGWGTTTIDSENMIRGQLWDAFLSTSGYTADTTTTVTLDSNTWYVITSSNNGNLTLPSSMKGSLFLIANP